MKEDKISNTLFLTQTDTTIGFISKDADRLTRVKQRSPQKYYIKAVDSLATLKLFTRVPDKHKNRLRRASKSTFIMSNGYSYRVIKDKHHHRLIKQLKWAYSTSANLSGQDYDEKWARGVVDKIIEPLNDRGEPSSIFILNNRKIRRIR